ncbi:MAG: FlgD immunoglobulin-like domain containing protein, partial [Sideroxyarcus sp.]|nr:FlgD immunoglobulin-like domain containing protein [Sideroxyarcus sp.]
DNVVYWWKGNDNIQKVQYYNIYRQPIGTTTPPTSSDLRDQVQNIYGGPATHTYTDVGAGSKGKAVYVYSIKSANYYGNGSWGAAGNNQFYEEDLLAPPRCELLQNCPNPIAGGATTIKYALLKQGQTSLKVYNLLGEEIKTLVNGIRPAGFHTVNWNGSDNLGRQVSNGVYFYRLASGEFKAVNRMIVLR